MARIQFDKQLLLGAPAEMDHNKLRVLAVTLVVITSHFSALRVPAETPKVEVILSQADRELANSAAVVLEKHCVACHNGDNAKGGLNLSNRTALLDGGESGPVFLDSQPDASRLWKLVSHQEKPGMPYQRPKLDAEELSVFKAWLMGGVPYSRTLTKPASETWWSLKPLILPPLPELSVERVAWCRNPVDRFVAAMHASKGMAASPEADRRTLLRRVTFDLTGLPPTPEEMRDFLQNDSPDAYEQAVNRLLNSPHYGERWARFWMDLVHFAETHGHDQDRPRPNAWPYRDYLIQSFNNDKPYVRFVQEQIAGDVMWPGDPQALIAPGFLAAGPWDESSLRDIRDDTLDRQIARYLDRDDIVTTTMSTFVSTTVHCARCHDHKFDPISQTDYYRLQAVFSGIDKGERQFDADPQVGQRRLELQHALARLPTQLATVDPSLLEADMTNRVAKWEQSLRASGTAWHILHPELVQSEQGTTLTPLPDGSYLATGTRPERDTYTFRTTISNKETVSRLTGLRLEVLLDDSLFRKGPGRQDNGNLHLNEIQVTAGPVDGSSAERIVKLIRPRADFNQQDWSIEKSIDGNANSAWGIYPEIGHAHTAIFEFADPIDLSQPVKLTVSLVQSHGGGHLIGRPRLSVTGASSPLPLESDVLPSVITDSLKVEPALRTDRQRAELAAYVLKQDLELQLAALPAQGFVYTASNVFKPDGGFAPSRTPRPVHLLKRGDIRRPDMEVTPGALGCIPGLGGDFSIADPNQEGLRRIALARWITDPQNTLAWRSIVNRVWQRHFGRGLVDTPNDFGQMGSSPTHPELLDWLAVTFRDGNLGGAVKELDRLLVTSATYRQSSATSPEFAKMDADNRYLWRMTRTRLDAECVRDTTLMIANRLDRAMGGPSVKQFVQTPPIHVTPGVDYLSFDADRPENQRRSVYRFLFRTLPDPFMETLDCADSSQLTPARNLSITALQALATMNNKVMVRLCEHLSSRVAQEAIDTQSQVNRLYELILNREPSTTERTAVEAYAREFGLANAARIVLNSNEFLFVD